VVRAFIILAMVVICFVLLALTDLGKPKVDPKPQKQPATHVDGVLLRR
jgi:hypothetical protein